MSMSDQDPKKRKSPSKQAPLEDELDSRPGFDEKEPGQATDRTSVTTIQENTITRLPGRIVPVLQVSAGAEQGRLISLNQYKDLIAGRGKECELVTYDPSCSRKHVQFFTATSGKVFIKDLGSTNGTKVNGTKLEPDQPFELSDGSRIQLGEQTILRFSLMPEDDAQSQMEVYLRATRDRLTNAFNRHQFDEALDREISYQKRAGHKLGIILFDVDHFKHINDNFGHPAGDQVLKEIGERVPTCIRNEDIFARIGGEEFAVLVRIEDEEGMRILAERIRLSMDKKTVEFEGKSISFAVSVGCAYVIGNKAVTTAALMQLADDALYEAKNTGRNRTVIKPPIK
jgi:two-component system cell cycle response regulator